MDFKFNKDSNDAQPLEERGEKKNQNALLVLLLILVGGFTYLYFFTDLIKPQESQKTAEATAPAPQIVKMPLPPRSGEPDGVGTKTPEKPDGTKTTATTSAPVAASVPAAKPPTNPATSAIKPVTLPTIKATAAKTMAVPAKVNTESTKSITAKSPDKKLAGADKKNIPAKAAIKKPHSETQSKPKTVAKAKDTATGPWSILVGNYVLEETLSADMGRVRKAGFKPTIKPATRKRTAMSRLLVSEYSERATALPTLEKLKRYTSDAFIIEHNGKYVVYAGSYLQREAAETEKARLNAAGFSVTIKRADIAIPTQNLSIGPFKNKGEAAAALVKLKRAGIHAALSQK